MRKRTKKPKSSKLGRPSGFDSIDLEEVKALFLDGKTDSQVAVTLGIDLSTLYRWRKKNPTFCKAIKDFKEVADARVERALYERATGYSHKATKFFCSDGSVIREDYVEHCPPDPTSMIFWLKNRQPAQWRDKVDHEHSGDLILTYGHRNNKKGDQNDGK